MKFIAIFCFVFSFGILTAQPPVVIDYAAVTSFHWGLFKGKINPRHIEEMGENTGAVTVSSISYTAQQTSPTSANVSITARFHPNDSWTRYPNLTKEKEALEHERRHLEITEIYARKLRKLVTHSKFTAGNFKEELNKQFNDLVTQHRAEQVKYDHETNHSINADQQKKWNTKVDAQLKSLSAYTSTNVVIKFTR